MIDIKNLLKTYEEKNPSHGKSSILIILSYIIDNFFKELESKKNKSSWKNSALEIN